MRPKNRIETKKSVSFSLQCRGRGDPSSIFRAGLQRGRTAIRRRFCLDWCGACHRDCPARENAPSSGCARPQAITIKRVGELHITDGQLKSYEKCPRRYFYTHVLKLGGARKTTAFSQTHDCIYQLIEWLAISRRDGESTLDAAEAAFNQIWQERGPIDHGYATEYRSLVLCLIGALLRAGGRVFRDSQPLAIDFASGALLSSQIKWPNCRTGPSPKEECKRGESGRMNSIGSNMPYIIWPGKRRTAHAIQSKLFISLMTL